MNPLELLLGAALVGVAAFLAASEVAIFSLSRFQLKTLKERFRSTHRRVKRLIADPGGVLIAILATNEVVNIALSTLVTHVVSRHHLPVPAFLKGAPQWAYDAILDVLFTTPVILFACEITPKVIAARMNQIVATLTVRPLTWVYEALLPLRWLLRGILRAATKVGTEAGEHGSERSLINPRDFIFMVEEGLKEGAVQEKELELIRNVFELDDTPVAEIVTPLHQVQTVPAHMTLQGALMQLRTRRFSRIPVIGKSRKDIVGILHAKDLIRAKLNPALAKATVDSIMRKPLVVPSALRLNALFRRFKELQTHMAVVQGAHGELVGIATMNDVLQALFEDLLPGEDDDDGEEGYPHA